MKKSLNDTTRHMANQPKSLDFGGRAIVNANLVKCTVEGQPVGPGGGGAKNAITYDEQSLTDAQKLQARTNIGAGSAADVSTNAAAIAAEVSRATEADETLQQMIAAVDRGSYETAWDGSSTPVVANIPAGVTVTYSSTDYTGTLAAEDADATKIYLVSDGDGEFLRYKVSQSGDTYSWELIGSTEIPLEDYATKAELSQLDQKVGDLEDDTVVLQQQIDAITPIVIEGDVTNAPDEEDITTDSADLLKFKDRAAGVGRMGYKILRKDATFASQVTDANTIFEIRYDFDLDNASVTIPAGCVLKFNGGTVFNGTVVGSNSYISAPRETIFGASLSVSGSFCSAFFAEWFGAKADASTDNLAAFQRIAALNDYIISFSKGTYRVSGQVNAANSTCGWIGELGNTNQWTLDGTIFKYIGNDDDVFVYLPKTVKNITFIGSDNTVYNDFRNQTSFIATGISLGYPGNFVQNRIYENITVAFFRVGLQLESSFGCVFNRIKCVYNYIGINADPTKVSGQDSGYVTLITFNGFAINMNGYAGIAKVSTEATTRVNAYFQNGYIENNGHLQEGDDAIEIITNPSSDALLLGNFTFSNTYGEGAGYLAQIGNANLTLLNCSFANITKLEVRYGRIDIISSRLPSCEIVFKGPTEYHIQNSEINPASMQNKAANKIFLENVLVNKSYAGNSGATDNFFVTTLPQADSSKLDAYKVPVNMLFFDTRGGIVFKKANYKFGNLPAGTTTQRPTMHTNMQGYVYFDTTLGKPIYWQGSKWVYADGTDV